MKPPDAVEAHDDEAGNTGFPLLRSWKTVYVFVLGCFALWLALLIILTKVFS
jgi:hypothetical protein